MKVRPLSHTSWCHCLIFNSTTVSRYLRLTLVRNTSFGTSALLVPASSPHQSTTSSVSTMTNVWKPFAWYVDVYTPFAHRAVSVILLAACVCRCSFLYRHCFFTIVLRVKGKGECETQRGESEWARERERAKGYHLLNQTAHTVSFCWKSA